MKQRMAPSLLSLLIAAVLMDMAVGDRCDQQANDCLKPLNDDIYGNQPLEVLCCDVHKYSQCVRKINNCTQLDVRAMVADQIVRTGCKDSEPLDKNCPTDGVIMAAVVMVITLVTAIAISVTCYCKRKRK